LRKKKQSRSTQHSLFADSFALQQNSGHDSHLVHALQWTLDFSEWIKQPLQSLGENESEIQGELGSLTGWVERILLAHTLFVAVASKDSLQGNGWLL